MDPLLAGPDLASLSVTGRMRAGMGYVPRGARVLLAHHELWPYVGLPILVTMAALTAAGWVTWWGVPTLLDLLWVPAADTAPLLLGFWAVARVLLSGSLFVMALVFWYFAAGIMVIPFNDKLSERVEALVLGAYEEEFSWRVLLGDLSLSVVHSVVGLVLWAVTMFSLFLLNLVPGVGSVVSTVLSFGASGFFLSRETMDGALSRRRMSFRHKLKTVWANLAVAEGFGMVAAVTMWIPLLNFLTLPIAVVGGTLLLCHLEQQGLVPSADGRGAFASPRKRLGAT